MFDCLIIGWGPAGLMATTYLGCFRRRVIVTGAGDSRAKCIPVTRNCPAFPDGISGVALLSRMRRKPFDTGPSLWTIRFTTFVSPEPTFVAAVSCSVRARSVFIAAGVVDRLPESPDVARMIEAGTLRLCPICDMCEVINKRVVAPGSKSEGFVRTKVVGNWPG